MNNRLKNKWTKRLFPIFALLLLLPWPIAYTYESYAADDQDTVQIEIAEASARPTWARFEKAIGGVDTPGDLFYIDTTNNPADIQATLYITNANELISYYRYLILEVGVYVESNAGEWEKASMGNGESIPDTFITMRNGHVNFTLPGLAKYKITIDSGSFYCTTTNTDSGSFSPQLYLEVD